MKKEKEIKAIIENNINEIKANDALDAYEESLNKEYDNNEKHLDSIFEIGYKDGYNEYAKPASKWLMKKKWGYSKEERQAYNLGYKHGNTILDKEKYDWD